MIRGGDEMEGCFLINDIPIIVRKYQEGINGTNFSMLTLDEEGYMWMFMYGVREDEISSSDQDDKVENALDYLNEAMLSLSKADEETHRQLFESSSDVVNLIDKNLKYIR
jgi:hypothetical protein